MSYTEHMKALADGHINFVWGFLVNGLAVISQWQ